LVVRSLQKYQISHHVELQQTILSFLTQLVHFGVDFSRLDKEYTFLNYVINQITGKHCYLPQPPLLLPCMFNFLAALYIVRRLSSQVSR
jgi:hypothetical protein